MLEVIEAGLHSTVQDRGREGYGHLGVRRAGAADQLALAAANMLIDNDPGTAALEMTLLGGRFAVLSDTVVGLAGAAMEAHVLEDGRRLSPAGSHALAAGTTLVLGGATDGARTYLALPGGIRGERALGSASTDPNGGFGGLHGRPLQPGDRLEALDPGRRVAERGWPPGLPWSGIVSTSASTNTVGTSSIALIAGPHLDRLPDAREALTQRGWMVTPKSDRVGLRLDGVAIGGAESIDLISMPMLPGAIQVPSSGLPIVLLPDAPTVGGYPVPAMVAEADHDRLGQLRAGDDVRFEWISLGDARQLAKGRSARLRAAATALR